MPPPGDGQAGGVSNLNDLWHQQSLDTSRITSATDFAKILAQLGDYTLGAFGKLPGQAGGLLSDVLSGGGTALRTLMSPFGAALSSQTGQAQRQLADTTPQGGALAQGQTQLHEGALGEYARAFSGLLGNLGGQALSVGTGLPSTMAGILGGAGQLVKKAPSGGGGLS